MVTVETSDLTGMPVHCRCSLCGQRWTRPGEDPEAKTLPSWARTHHCTRQLAATDRSWVLAATSSANGSTNP